MQARRANECPRKQEGRYFVDDICGSVRKMHIFEKGDVLGRYVLGKGLSHKKRGVLEKRASKRRGVLEKRNGLEKGYVRKERSVREGV